MEQLDIGPNDLLLRKYRIQGVVGKGGTSVVFAAQHEQLGTRVAIKVLSVSADDEEDATRRFLREARAAAALRSPHVARILDVDIDELGRRCQVMELLEGRDLSRVIGEESPLPIAQAVGYVSHVCAGMEEAHAAGILHRDLKPQNLFLTTASTGEPLVKVLDFGVSKILDSRLRATAGSTTDSGMLLGTPLYMSPERLKCPADAEPRADVWALGTILFELLTGKPPFAAPTLPGLIAVLLSDDPPASVRVARPDVPGALADIIESCLQKDVAQRMPSMAQLREALRPWAPAWAREAAQSSIPPVGRRPGVRSSRMAEGTISRRLRAFGVGVLAVVAAVVVVLAVRSPVGSSVSPPRPSASQMPARSPPPPRAAEMLVEPLPAEGSGAPAAAVTAAPIPERRKASAKGEGHAEWARRTRAADPLEGRE